MDIFGRLPEGVDPNLSKMGYSCCLEAEIKFEHRKRRNFHLTFVADILPNLLIHNQVVIQPSTEPL